LNPALNPGLREPLQWLMGDRADDFLSDIYEQQAFVARHGDPRRYSGLLTISDIDRIVAELDLQRGMLTMANATRRPQESDFVASSGAIDRAAVVRLYQQGGTVILNQLQESVGSLASLCRSLEQVFSCHVQTNTYLTPPSAQGFHTHYDNHDVFVIQIEGSKAWRLFDRPVAAPYRGEQFEPGVHPVGEPVETFVLNAGDCAYVPRGLMHDAATSGDTPSLHITCGLIVRTWADLVLEAVSEVCLEDTAFRRSLPPGFARPDFDRSQVGAEFAGLMRRLAEKTRSDNALDLAITQFVNSREPDVSGALDAAHAPLAARYALRPTLWRLEDEEIKGAPGLRLIAPGGDLTFTDLTRPELERILSGQPFAPEDLGTDDRTDIIRRLVSAGLIAATSA
jgi:ribosomal protein L16 Arg81 hydroxylase